MSIPDRMAVAVTLVKIGAPSMFNTPVVLPLEPVVDALAVTLVMIGELPVLLSP